MQSQAPTGVQVTIFGQTSDTVALKSLTIQKLTFSSSVQTSKATVTSARRCFVTRETL